MTGSHLAARRTLVVTVFILALAILGCRQYGAVSPMSYQFAKALYSLCNRNDELRLDTIDQAIKDAVASGELPADEAAYLQDIINKADNGKWAEAMQDCRTLMSEQNVQT